MNATKGEAKQAIRLENVSKSYDMGEVTVHALKNVSLTVVPDEVTVILGASGCGKTTLLNLIGGIDNATSGRIRINGTDVTSLNQKQLTKYRQDHIGFVFQFFNLIPNLTARENVEFVLEYVLSMKGDGVSEKAQDILAKVGLGDRGDHYPYQLSGGEQQRVAIARALCKEPRIVLADEPTGELDYRTGLQILELLTSFAKEGRAVLIVTHNKELARIANTVIRLRDGKVLEVTKNSRPAAVSTLEW